MIVRHFLTTNNESNVFLVACAQTREALLVDAGGFPITLVNFIQHHELKLTTVFVTHDHYDHTDAVGEALPYGVGKVLSGTGRVGGRLACPVTHGNKVQVGRWTGEVLDTPGHTPDSMSLVFPGVVFTGDALFAGSVGGTNSAANAQLQIDNIRKHIFSLPVDYEIHPGHGPSSTVGIERRYNPFFN